MNPEILSPPEKRYLWTFRREAGNADGYNASSENKRQEWCVDEVL